MIEVLLVIYLCKKVGDVVRPKGYSVGLWRFFMVLGWVGGEITGGVIGGIMAAASAGNAQEPSMGVIYVCTLVGAALGAVIVFELANALGSKEPPRSSWPSTYAPPPTTPRRDSDNPYQP
jgi:hypothetical protein